jgi:hypothetical protein
MDTINVVDPELIGQDGSGLGIIVPDPDLPFLARKSVLL